MKTSIITRWAAAAAVAVASLVAVPAAPATAAGADHVVINEVYNNGGSANAVYTNKYVEIYNPTQASVSLDGWSLQYRTANGTAAFSGVVAFGNRSIPAGGYLLLSGGSNGAVGGALPTPDYTAAGALNSAGGGGTFALVNSTTALTGDRPTILANADVVDVVGYGTSMTYEGSAAATAGSVTESVSRNATHDDTNVNSADFAKLTPATPCNSAGCPVVVPPADPDPVPATIEAIQGTGEKSPLDGTTVTTTGVVTAVYPSGGLSGGFIQTPGTGGTAGTTSHGLFVFGSAFAAGVAKGDYVEVTGKVSEFGGTTAVPSTLTEITTSAGKFKKLDTPAAAAVPTPVTFPLSSAAKEALESMVVAPQGTLTITNNFTTNQYGEIGLAPGTKPFDNPTNVVAPGAAAQALQAKNTEDLVTVDDGASINFLSTASGHASQNIPLPWLTPTNEVRVGQTVTFDDPVVLDWRNSAWKLQPLQQLTAGGNEPLVFGPSTRAAAPGDVGGAITIGTFNVLNYFSTTAEEFVAAGLGTCTTYDDRADDPVTANSCSNNGPRGAAEEEDFQRQQAKIVTAINTLDASVVSLEEIENSIAVEPGADRDEALSTLVDALNAAAGSTRWAFVPSPAQIPTGEDVIRTAFIYQPALVTPVGASKILIGATAFDNAREPLAQAFRPLDGGADTTFAVIVNHFKSKSSGSLPGDADQGDGQGASNASRVAQANALVTFADSFAQASGTDRVFLTGDFNAYAKEDPVTILEKAGYVNVPAEYTDKQTYQFGGGIGSLDHVFASPAANDRVTGADIWNINAYESVAREYSRFNYNATNFYDASPFRASDHDPTLVGFDPGAVVTTTTADAPATIRSGDDLTVDVDVTGGATTPTGSVTLTEDGTTLVTADVKGGSAALTVPGLPIGTHVLTAAYSGDATHAASSDTVSVEVLRAAATFTATARPGTYGTSTTVDVVGAPGSSGLVYVAAGDQLVGMGLLANGTASVALSSTLPVGTTALTVFYGGDGSFDPATTSTSVTVAKAATSIRKVSVSPSTIVVKRTKPFITLRVSASGFTVDGGIVTVRASGKTYAGTVRDGQVRIRVGTFTSSGPSKKVTATYSGNGQANGSSTAFTVKVRKK